MPQAAKVWIERKEKGHGRQILGERIAKLLREIRQTNSIAKAAENLSMPYRTAWEHIRRIERVLGKKIVETRRGGARGGGSAKLTHEGEKILREYERYERFLDNLTEEECLEAIFMKISARNYLRGVVKSVEKDGIAAKVRIEIKAPAEITALITREAVEELNLKEGDDVEAVIKATEVLVAKSEKKE